MSTGEGEVWGCMRMRRAKIGGWAEKQGRCYIYSTAINSVRALSGTEVTGAVAEDGSSRDMGGCGSHSTT